MLTIRGGQIKLPDESHLFSIYSLISAPGNTKTHRADVSHFKWEFVILYITLSAAVRIKVLLRSLGVDDILMNSLIIDLEKKVNLPLDFFILNYITILFCE